MIKINELTSGVVLLNKNPKYVFVCYGLVNYSFFKKCYVKLLQIDLEHKTTGILKINLTDFNLMGFETYKQK